jgi:nucleotide-binding universal stress UspA family protein
MGQKIFVAMDESENAARAIDFIIKNFTNEHEITLFNVMMDTASICDMNSPELTPYFTSQQTAFCSLEDKKKELVNQALQKARNRLKDNGFDEERLVIKTQPKKRGIARDIIDEANRGYDILVIGRRGISGLKEFFIGSVSNKVISGIKDISVVLIN